MGTDGAMSLGREFHRRKKVLVVDDNVESVKLATYILDHLDCDVTMAFDGDHCVPYLVSQKFDLVILDWSMPILGGRDVLLSSDRIIDKKPAMGTSNLVIPVVIYSGHDLQDLDIPQCRHFTVQSFISKEMNIPKMMKTLGDTLRRIDDAA